MIIIKKYTLYSPYRVLLVIYLFFILIAFLLDSPENIYLGLMAIIKSPDILVTDYVELGGISASLINASLTGILSIVLLVIQKIKPNGSTIMSLWLMTGFSFFGKNIFNIWPIIIGVYLYSKYQKEPFINYSLVALLSTTLSPAVSQLIYTNKFSTFGGILLGYSLGIIIGFIIAPISSHCLKSHNGYNLYNVGFSGGLLATIVMSVFRAFGIDFGNRLLWNTKHNFTFSLIIIGICLYLIGVGLYHNNKPKESLLKLFKEPGRLISDFYLLYGGNSYINMGILGLLSTGIVLILNSNLNGPTISGIFTIIGFGAFGKHILNVLPILSGAILAAIIDVDPINSPSLIIAILFSTALSPIAGKYGWKLGVLTGFLHVCTVTNISYLHGGMNLYNNGLAAGIIAMVLIPIISIFQKEI